jgi:hypothetical protein
VENPAVETANLSTANVLPATAPRRTPAENLCTPVDNPGNGNGATTYAVGDRLTDGRRVLEVDEHGRPVVVERLPHARSDPDAAVQRIVDIAAQVGHRFDRAGRRRLRERLLGGETEEQLRAPYERQLATLQREDVADADDLDQAMRLMDRPA